MAAPNFIQMYQQALETERSINDPRLAENFLKGAQAGSTIQQSAARQQAMEQSAAREPLILESMERRNALENLLFEENVEAGRLRNDVTLANLDAQKLAYKNAQQQMGDVAVFNKYTANPEVQNILTNFKNPDGILSLQPPTGLSDRGRREFDDWKISQFNAAQKTDAARQVQLTTEQNQIQNLKNQAEFQRLAGEYSGTLPVGITADANGIGILTRLVNQQKAGSEMETFKEKEKFRDSLENKKSTEGALTEQQEKRLTTLGQRATNIIEQLKVQPANDELQKELKTIRDEQDAITLGEKPQAKASDETQYPPELQEVRDKLKSGEYSLTTKLVLKGPRGVWKLPLKTIVDNYDEIKAAGYSLGSTPDQEESIKVEETITAPSPRPVLDPGFLNNYNSGVRARDLLNPY